MNLWSLWSRKEKLMNVPILPSREEFHAAAQSGANVIPVYTRLAADFETPLSAYLKLREGKYSYLFESAESAAASGRWSILGTGARYTFTSQGSSFVKKDLKTGESNEIQAEVLKALEEEMRQYLPFKPDEANLPPFFGGMVGYLSYDAVSQFEPTVVAPSDDDLGLPDAVYFLSDTILAFDHHLRKVHVIANAYVDGDNVDEAYDAAAERVRVIVGKLDQPIHLKPFSGLADAPDQEVRSNTTQAEYEEMVVKAKEYIAAGDAFQIVPSQRFEVDFDQDPVDLYRALRHINPSPYMFILENDGFSLVGSSPEVHVRSVDGRIDIRPIAGTRWRGKTPEEDDALAAELLADEKEIAEHVMLIDLARNDVGRISKPGSVVVSDQMIIERYSHVMHIVSNVHGDLDEEHSAYDVLRSTFPAGTVSGSPKIRAMQIINELEKNKRCSYSGAVGYFGYDGNHDSCIALRTCLLKGGKAYVQAGAGVVADSNPIYEYVETCNKAKAVLKAVALAKAIF